MEVTEIISSFRQSIAAPTPGVDVQELTTDDSAAITVYRSSRQNTAPQIFSFYVPKGVVVVAIRLAGTSIITSHVWQRSNLLQAGSVYLLAEGSYSVIFGRRTSETVFLVFDRSSVPGIESFMNKQQGNIPLCSIDVNSDPVITKVNSISSNSSRNSYFKFSGLLMDILDRLSEQSNTAHSIYGLPQLEEPFVKLCDEVVAHPDRHWNIGDAAESCGYSVYHFSRTFRAKTGSGFPEFVNRVRSTQAVMLMCDEGVSLESAFQRVGIEARSAANKLLIRELGLSRVDVRRVLALTAVNRAS